MPATPTTTAGLEVLVVVACVVGYLFGSVNPAAIIARLRGADLRGTGSGNPGATNAARTMGVGIGVLVGVLDVLKGLIPALVFSAIWPMAGYAAGFAAVLGHITSPFLRGHGGKGVATALGAILGTTWVWVIPVLAVFAVVVAITRRVGLGAVAGAVALVPASLVYHPETGGILFAVALAGLVVLRHRRNLAAAAAARHPSEG